MRGGSGRMLCAATLAAAIGVGVPAPGSAQGADDVEARSLLGEPLRSLAIEPEARARMERQLAEARAAYERDPDDADAIIWLGRRLADLGRYRDAIEVFSEGIRKHPTDARLDGGRRP